MMLVKKDKVDMFNIVYKLLKLVLVLPVATAGVERIFSTMNYIKNKLRYKMGQDYLNDGLVTFIEREFFLQAKDEHHQPLSKHEGSEICLVICKFYCHLVVNSICCHSICCHFAMLNYWYLFMLNNFNLCSDS